MPVHKGLTIISLLNLLNLNGLQSIKETFFNSVLIDNTNSARKFQMTADEWLDSRARRAIRQREIGVVEIDEVDPVRPRKVKYDESRLSVALPETEQIQRIEYVPPTLELSEYTGTPSLAPNFQTPQPAFNVFEHFQFEWIEIPELE